ncbi:hypothetical protein T06_5743, partial [Trichinella sp. T6]
LCAILLAVPNAVAQARSKKCSTMTRWWKRRFSTGKNWNNLKKVSSIWCTTAIWNRPSRWLPTSPGPMKIYLIAKNRNRLSRDQEWIEWTIDDQEKMRGRLLEYKQQEQHEASMNSAAKRDGANELMNSDAPAEMVIKT